MKTERQVIADILQYCNEHLNPELNWRDREDIAWVEAKEDLAEKIIDLIPDGIVESIKRNAGE